MERRRLNIIVVSTKVFVYQNTSSLPETDKSRNAKTHSKPPTLGSLTTLRLFSVMTLFRLWYVLSSVLLPCVLSYAEPSLLPDDKLVP